MNDLHVWNWFIDRIWWVWYGFDMEYEWRLVIKLTRDWYAW